MTSMNVGVDLCLDALLGSAAAEVTCRQYMVIVYMVIIAANCCRPSFTCELYLGIDADPRGSCIMHTKIQDLESSSLLNNVVRQ